MPQCPLICVKIIHREKVENTILQHGIQPYVRSIISSHDAQFLQNVSTRAASVGVFTQPGPLAAITAPKLSLRGRAR
jgi:hypothetical protein